MNICNVCLFFLSLSIEFGVHDARGHCRDSHFLGGTNGVQVCVDEFYLPRIFVIDQYVLVHEVNADNLVFEFSDDVYRICNFLPLIHSNRKDCFQVKSNLLTNFQCTTHMNIMILN